MLTKIATIVADGYKFKKVLGKDKIAVYVFNEFGEIVDEFISYATDFDEFAEDVEWYLKQQEDI